VNALPLLAKAAIAAVLIGSMARAFLGPPAPGEHRAWARALLAGTALCYCLGAALVVAAGAALTGSVVVMVGIEAACIAAWLVRALPDGPGRDDDEGGGGGWGRGPWSPIPPVDWDAFDRARREWDRPRVG
jgi:hypothetical protein